jgi:ABC-type nitrate/sulfonate/bicarbonate transport system substrate-binding protein
MALFGMCKLVRAFGLSLVASAVFGSSPSFAEEISMAFTGSPTTLSLPFFVAQKKGWLGDLKVKEVYVTGDSNAMRVLLAKNVDIATVGTVNILTSIEAGAEIVAIDSWQPLPDYNVVIKKGEGDSVKDLAGKTIATSGPGGLPDQLVRLLMRKNNVDESGAHFVQVGGHAARLQSVLGGRAQATLVNIVIAAKGADAVNVVTTIPKEFPKLAYVWNVVRKESLSDPKLSKAFETLTAAGIKGSRFIMQHPDEAAQILHDRVPELDLDLCKKAVAELNAEHVWGVDGGLDASMVEFTADLNNKLGLLKKPLAASAVIDTRYIDAALKSLGNER